MTPPCNTAMAIHPPSSSRATSSSDPLAFAVARSSTRNSTRADPLDLRFALIAWLLLSSGVALGARWVLQRARMGRLLAWIRVETPRSYPADRHRFAALDHGRIGRDAANVERLADLRHLRPLAPRTVPGPLASCSRSTPLARSSRRAAALPDRHGSRSDDDPDRLAPRLACLRAAADSLMSRESVFLLQHILASRSPRVDPLRTFPLSLRNGRLGEVHRPPWFQPVRHAAGDRARFFFMGIGRCSPGDGSRSPAFAGPGSRRRTTAALAVVLLLTTRHRREPGAFVLFLAAAFTILASPWSSCAESRPAARSRCGAGRRP